MERTRNSENEKDKQIEKHHKIVLLPDRIFEAIDRRIKFQPR